MINVIYCCNDKLFEGVFLSAASVARRSGAPVRISVFTMDGRNEDLSYVPFSKDHTSIINAAIKTFDERNEAAVYDLTEQFEKAFGGGKNLKNEFTPYALLRLLADDEKVAPFDKAIYLDADTMACGDIEELWNTDVSDYEYAAALDRLGKFWVARNYCNSGVLLLNLKKIRETGMFVKCRKLIKTKRFFMPDQTAIHRSATARLYLDTRFNEQRSVKPDTVIKHFNRSIKWLPFPHFFNVKQWDRKAVRDKLKIRVFDEDYAFYDDFIKTEKHGADADEKEKSNIL